MSNPKVGATRETGVPFPIILLERPNSRKPTPSRGTPAREVISFPARPRPAHRVTQLRREAGGPVMPGRRAVVGSGQGREKADPGSAGWCAALATSRAERMSGPRGEHPRAVQWESEMCTGGRGGLPIPGSVLEEAGGGEGHPGAWLEFRRRKSTLEEPWSPSTKVSIFGEAGRWPPPSLAALLPNSLKQTVLTDSSS